MTVGLPSWAAEGNLDPKDQTPCWALTFELFVDYPDCPSIGFAHFDSSYRESIVAGRRRSTIGQHHANVGESVTPDCLGMDVAGKGRRTPSVCMFASA